MPSDKTNLKYSILDSVAKALVGRGFVVKAATGIFTRSVGGAVEVFQLVFLDERPGWIVQPHIGIRFEEVEKLFHHSSRFEIKSQRSTLTVGAAIGVLQAEDARHCEFKISSDRDVPSVTEQVIESFDHFALKYFERFGSLSAIDHDLNDRPCERTPNRAVPWLRCSTGIIVAKLVNRPNFDEIESCYIGMMNKISNGFYAKKFGQLLEELRNVDLTDVERASDGN